MADLYVNVCHSDQRTTRLRVRRDWSIAKYTEDNLLGTVKKVVRKKVNSARTNPPPLTRSTASGGIVMAKR